MKTTLLYITIIALVCALVIVSLKRAGQGTDSCTADTTSVTEQSAIDIIMTRASVRVFTDQRVSASAIDTLLRAAMAAPTAMNAQPWHFVVVQERAILDSIHSLLPNVQCANPTPLAILVCGDMNLALQGEAQSFWIQDCSAATENLLLAAHAMGLGAVWCGIHPSVERESILRSILSLPRHLVPLNVVAIGYPKNASTPKEKFDPTKVSYE